MAKKYKSKYKSAVDGYKSKHRDRKRRGADIGGFLGAGASILGALAMPSTKRKKRKATSKHTSSTSRNRNSNTQDQLTLTETIQGIIAVIILGIIGTFAIEIILNVGFKGFLILILTIFIIIVTIIVIINQHQETHPTNQQYYDDIDENQIIYLQSLPDKINKYQSVINNSDNVDDVKKNLDWLLGLIDEIMSYDDELLNRAGITKETLPQQKEFILKNYDTVLKQAQERYSETNNISTSDVATTTSPSQPATTPILSDNNEEDVPSLESRISRATPSKQGLYPHEILMLSYAHTYKVSNNKFQGFWYYLYSVKEPQTILTSLYERGFVTLGDLKDTIEKLKVTELKEELVSIGEKTTGKKAELITRLLEKGDTNYLSQKYQERYYTLTEKGEQELNDNNYVAYLHKTKYISVWDMNYLLNINNSSSLAYRDILWNEFNRQSNEHLSTGNFGLYRNTRLYMYQFLMEENKYESAFSMLCEVIAYDLSGLGNNEPLIIDSVTKKYLLEELLRVGFPYSNSLYTIPPAITGWTEKIKELLNLNDNCFRAALLENFEKINLHRRIFTNEECVEIVMNEIGNHPRKQSALYRNAEERLRNELASLK